MAFHLIRLLVVAVGFYSVLFSQIVKKNFKFKRMNEQITQLIKGKTFTIIAFIATQLILPHLTHRNSSIKEADFRSIF